MCEARAIFLLGKVGKRATRQCDWRTSILGLLSEKVYLMVVLLVVVVAG